MPLCGSQDCLICGRRNADGPWRQALERGDQVGRRLEGFVLVGLIVVRHWHLQRVKCASMAKGSALEELSGAFVLAQGLEGMVETGFDRAEGDVHRFGDLRQAKPVHKTEPQHLALLFR